MGNITLYRFETYNGINDEIILSTRYGTVSGIQRIGGQIKEPGVLVNDSVRLDDGLTEKNFDPSEYPPVHAGFQTVVR